MKIETFRVFSLYFTFFSLRDTSDRIFALIRDLASGRKTVKFSEVMERCVAKGFNPDQLEKCVEEYEELNVWQVNQTRTQITFI